MNDEYADCSDCVACQNEHVVNEHMNDRQVEELRRMAISAFLAQHAIWSDRDQDMEWRHSEWHDMFATMGWLFALDSETANAFLADFPEYHASVEAQNPFLGELV